MHAAARYKINYKLVRTEEAKEKNKKVRWRHHPYEGKDIQASELRLLAISGR